MNATIRVYVLTQPYINERKDKGVITNVTIHRIQRISGKEWLPIFHITEESDQEVACVIKAKDTGNVRYWSSLDKLAEWIREEMEIYFPQLNLGNVELICQGENLNESN
ncbi:hypothetical protein [Salinicola sp. NYA28a]